MYKSIFVIFLCALSFGSHIKAQSLQTNPQRLRQGAPQKVENSLNQFELADGFKISIAVKEPEISDPVAMDFDSRGGLYVVEMRGYSERRENRLGRVRYLRDRDGDGYFETSTIFTDQLKWPTAVITWNGGVFVGATPDIIWFKDRDGDGKADEQKVLFSGFGSTRNKLNVQSLMNSFRWGVDNRIHGSSSGSGGMIKSLNNSAAPQLNVQGRDFSFDPVKLDMRLEGPSAQHGMSFDKWGKKFSCSNSDHIQYQMHRWSHLYPSMRSIAKDGKSAEVYRTSPEEPWRVIRTNWRLAGSVPGPIEGGGRSSGYFTAATGITIYKGNAFPPEYKGRAFIADTGSNLIHVKEMSWKNGILEANRIKPFINKEFLTSKDNWFRPVQFGHAPDGCLYVLDFYREIIEHPWSLPPGLKENLDLNRGFKNGRIYRISPENFSNPKPVDLNKSTNSELILLLAHDNEWHRTSAQKILYKRAQYLKDIPSLVEKFIDLELESKSNLNFLYRLLLLNSSLKKLSIERLVEVLNTTLSSKDQETDNFHSALFDYLLSKGSPYTREEKNLLLELIQSHFENSGKFIPPPIQSQFVYLSLSEQFSKSQLKQTLSLVNISNEWTNEALMNVLKRYPFEAFMALSDLFPDLPPNQKRRVFEILEALIQRIQSSKRRNSEIFKSLAVEHLNKNRAISLLIFSHLAPDHLKDLPSKDQLLKVCIDRIDSITSEISYVDEKCIKLFSILSALNEYLEAIVPDKSPISNLSVKRQIVRSGIFRNEPEISKALINEVRKGDYPFRDEAIHVLIQNQNLITLLDFLRQNQSSDIRKLIPGHEINKWKKSSNKKVVELAHQVFGHSRADGKEKQEIINKFVTSLDQNGDKNKGQSLFQIHCAQCHSDKGKSNSLGPEKTSLGSMPPALMLVNILDPNKEVAPQYLGYQIETISGDFFEGLMVADGSSDKILRIKLPGSIINDLYRDEVTNVLPTGKSLMPENFSEILSPSEMNDLISYIKD